jgi:ATP-binding cassette, subfamily B, bacterial
MTNPALRHLGGPLRAERPALTLSCVLSVLRIGVELARPWPLALAIDYALGDATQADPVRPSWLVEVSPTALLVACGLATVVLTAVSGLLDMGAVTAAEKAAERIGGDLRDRLFEHCLQLSPRWHARHRSGEVVSRVTSDVGRLLDAVVATTAKLIPNVLTVVGVLIVLLVVHPWLAALGLLVIPVLTLAAIRQRRLVHASETAARSASGRLAAITSDLVRNVATIQAFGRLDRAQTDFGKRNEDLTGAASHAVEVEARWAPRSDVVLAVGAGLVLVAGGLQVRAGVMTAGLLLVVISYLKELYAPIRSLTRLSAVLAKARASIERISEVFDADEMIPDDPAAPHVPAGPLGIVFSGVTFGYDPSRPVLRDLDLDVRPGETVCLLGPSGIGKSTLLLLVLRLYDVDVGSVTLDSRDIKTFRLQSLRRSIAYVPQDPWLLDATLAQNVAIGNRSASRAEVIAACRAANVDEFVDRLPLGYDTDLGEGAGRLSGGQRRRVALARAAVSDAAILMLDEPTASLDDAAAGKVICAIAEIAATRTTLIVTHDPRLATLADRAVMVDSAGISPVAGPSYQLVGGR